MKLAPIEIRKQEFKKSLRGYDTVEVDTFLELLANEYEKLINENTQLNKKIVTAEAELKHFKEVEKTLKQTLYNVQETSQISKENSQKQANLIKKEAELAATQLVEKARLEVYKMQEEVISLKQQKESFIARLRHLLSSQMELLDVLSIDDIDKADLKDKTKKSFTGTKKAPGKSSLVNAGLKRTQDKKEPSIPDSQKNKVEDKHPKVQPADNAKDKQGHDFFKDIFGESMDID